MNLPGLATPRPCPSQSPPHTLPRASVLAVPCGGDALPDLCLPSCLSTFNPARMSPPLRLPPYHPITAQPLKPHSPASPVYLCGFRVLLTCDTVYLLIPCCLSAPLKCKPQSVGFSTAAFPADKAGSGSSGGMKINPNKATRGRRGINLVLVADENKN